MILSSASTNSVVFGDTDNVTMDRYWLKENNWNNEEDQYSCQQVWISEFCQTVSKFTHQVSCIDGNLAGIFTCSCITNYNDDGNCISIGKCPYTCGLSDETKKWSAHFFIRLPNNVSEFNDLMCGHLNRTGRLCSECMEGLSPQVYSYDLNCIRCDNNILNWFKFIAVAFIPLTIFYFIVVLLRINATNPYLYGFITLNQLFASPIFLRACFLTVREEYKLAARLIALPYSVWNLDFFRSLPLNICLNLTTLQTLALDYAIAVYPLLLVVITYILIELHARGCRLVLCLWRPFHRCCVRFTRIMDIRSSIIKAFVTFLLLSYVKLLNSSIDMLLPTNVYNVQLNTFTFYVYYDASYKYFGKEHLPYAIMSILFFFVFILSPLVLLLVYPTRCFQKYCCGSRNQLLRTFVETFQGHYKDGTQPQTRDCRWFAAVYFLGRIILFYFIFGLTKGVMCFAFTGLTLILLGIVMVLFQPYKSAKVNTFHTILPFFMAFSCFLVTLLDEAEVKSRHMIRVITLIIGIVLALPLLAILLYAIYHCVIHKAYKKCQEHLHPNHQRSSERQSLIIPDITTNTCTYQVINVE